MRLPRSLAITGLCFASLVSSAQVPDASVQPVPPASIPAPAAPAAAPREEMIEKLVMRDAPLDLALQQLESLTGRTVLRPQNLPPATITLNINRPMPKSEALQALLSVLNLNNIGVVEMGDKFIKVVELANKTRTEAPMMITGSTLDLPASGKVVSKIFELNYLKASDLVAQLNTNLNIQLGGALAFTNTNVFLVTDSISNLQRVEQLLLALDRPASANFTPKFYTLRFAKASDLVTKIKLMMSGPNQATFGNSVTLSPDDRTNQIILIADPKQYAFYDRLVEKLDVKADPNTRNEVIYLKHATSKDVATLLGTVITGQNAALTKASNGSTRPGQTVVQPGANPNAPAAPANSTGFNNSGAASTTEFSTLLTVASDDRSNSIVVSGTVDDIRLIRELVEKIDVILAQVRIEVVIAEVTLTDTDASGISALNLTVTGGSIAKTGFSATGASELSAGSSSWSVTNGKVSPLAFDAALNGQGVKNKLRVLSAPTIVTTHNNEAEIVVGQSQPIITGSTSTPNSGSGGGNTTSSTVTYKDIAIDLKVTPLIGDDGNIQLKIDQKVDDVVGNVTIDGNSQPIIGTRKANSFVNVQDGQMIVLGGLQRTKKENDKTKLGFLFEWPVISWLFGARSRSDIRTELLLFIRPHVLPPEKGSAMTQKEIDRLSDHESINAYLKATDPYAPLPAPAPEKPAKSEAPSVRRFR
ncbi:MAG: secretin N-terminal domain-containing protein [Opitutaceae bacterium]|jgi:general secretion pathway protein D